MPNRLFPKLLWVFLPLVIAIVIMIAYCVLELEPRSAISHDEEIKDHSAATFLGITSLSVFLYVILAKFVFFFEEFNCRKANEPSPNS